MINQQAMLHANLRSLDRKNVKNAAAMETEPYHQHTSHPNMTHNAHEISSSNFFAHLNLTLENCLLKQYLNVSRIARLTFTRKSWAISPYSKCKT